MQYQIMLNAVCLAAENGREKVLRILQNTTRPVKSKESGVLKSVRDIALPSAAKNGHVEVVKLLLENAPS